MRRHISFPWCGGAEASFTHLHQSPPARRVGGFDATTELVPEALAKVGDGRPARRATSFMKAAIFDGWRKAHPDWPVVEKAETRTGADMIRVPVIVVAGQKVGPVWFTRRPDKAFDEFMSSMTDAPVVGALGGSGLRYFRVTVDYGGGVAVFER